MCYREELGSINWNFPCVLDHKTQLDYIELYVTWEVSYYLLERGI